MEGISEKRLVAYTIVEGREGKSYWIRIGRVFSPNRDGSYNIKLDALPMNGVLQIREWEPREDQPGTPRDARRSTPPPLPRDAFSPGPSS